MALYSIPSLSQSHCIRLSHPSTHPCLYIAISLQIYAVDIGVFTRWGTSICLLRPIQACYARRETAQAVVFIYPMWALVGHVMWGFQEWDV